VFQYQQSIFLRVENIRELFGQGFSAVAKRDMEADRLAVSVVVTIQTLQGLPK
jgi:hypothetical protein